jgi:teichoic acid transport system ATP-binding protein
MFAVWRLAVSINVDPDILIIDEALSVGDIFFQAKCFKKFDEFSQCR